MSNQKQTPYENVLVNKHSPFALSESFKTIRTNILYTGKNEKCPVYGITSSFGGSGKSVVIANLSQSFAQLGKKTILIDCDLRRPTQHKIFAVSNSSGVSEFLAGLECDIEKLVSHTLTENLDILTSGRIPPNPAELLAGENMEKLLNKLKESYDVIFIDFPPVTIVSDCIVPTKLVTGYIFVVRCGYDDSRQISSAIESMRKVDANIIGIVLNDINFKTGGYFSSKYRYGYSYKYKYKYGYGYSSKPTK